MKYIITKSNQPIIFPDEIEHCNIGLIETGLVDSCTISIPTPISAGIVTISHELKDVSCLGESFSLGIKSRPKEDREIIRKFLGFK